MVQITQTWNVLFLVQTDYYCKVKCGMGYCIYEKQMIIGGNNKISKFGIEFNYSYCGDT